MLPNFDCMSHEFEDERQRESPWDRQRHSKCDRGEMQKLMDEKKLEGEREQENLWKQVKVS